MKQLFWTHLGPVVFSQPKNGHLKIDMCPKFLLLSRYKQDLRTQPTLIEKQFLHTTHLVQATLSRNQRTGGVTSNG